MQSTTSGTTISPTSSRRPRSGPGMRGANAALDSRSSVNLPRGEQVALEQESASRNNADGPQANRRHVALRLGTLNICGLMASRGERRNKLANACSLMRANKWAILGVQETHESVEAAAALERSNGRIWAFPNAGENRNTAGTMFLIFRDFAPIIGGKESIKHDILIPGRAQRITFKWRGEEEISIVNIYAPNDITEAIVFFDELKVLLRKKPDIVIGDFNHIENAIDRKPDRGPPPSGIRTTLQSFRSNLNLVDGWREANQGVHSYTRTSPAINADGLRSQSRLDRVLVTPEMSQRAFKWDHISSEGMSDHDVASVEIFDDLAPKLGPGQWRMTPEDLEDPYLDRETQTILLECQRRMRHEDPMRVWLESKIKIRNVFESRQRMRKVERTKVLDHLKKARKKIISTPSFLRDQRKQQEAEMLEEKITEIKKAISDKRAATSVARYQLKGEAVNKYWFSIGKALINDSMIRGLYNDRGHLETSTDQMAEIAVKHHESLQSRPEMTDERKEAIGEMVTIASRRPINAQNKLKMASDPTENDVDRAIRASQTGKAPGKDGILYEFYKKWLRYQREKEKENSKEKFPCITYILMRVWNAPSRRNGAPEKYTEGLMTFLFKKGDKREIGNYRPITLLNTDYKLETKFLATVLTENVTSAIHEDQAGFVPGRDIMDHIKLAQVVEEYCETAEINGCLVALDQEKAYDRIDHEYLWRILDACNLPQRFIKRIRDLYKHARTSTMLNRTISRSFEINRGVRQGDPMSCLLFNLAIEPLAESLRESQLRGIRIPGLMNRLICKLFADDTQLYLSNRDDFSQAMAIAERWCLASTAKFNKSKTEILPMGTTEYRKAVVRTRSLRPEQQITDPFPEGARIYKDGEHLRILGGRVGHKVDTDAVWEPIVSKMETVAKKWSKRNMTFQGRKLAVNFIILSRAQFFLMTNPPTADVTKRIIGLVRNFIWTGKLKNALRLDTLTRPKEEGGLGIPDIEARITAAKLALVRKWALPAMQRPEWAVVLDKLLAKASLTPNDPRLSNMLYQDWRENRSHTSKLSPTWRNIFKTAYEYNVRVDGMKFNNLAKAGVPVWLSLMNETSRREENSGEMRHLRKSHGIINQGDLNRVPEVDISCKDHEICLGAARRLRQSALPRFNLQITTPTRADGSRDALDHTPRRIEANARAEQEDTAILLNPDVTHRADIALSVRIFGELQDQKRPPAFRNTTLPNEPGLVTIYTDGSADKNGRADSRCGAGLWSPNPEYCRSLRVSGQPPTNNRGEIAAATIALNIAPTNQELLIMTDSTFVINALNGGYKKYEDMGWLGITNADLIQRAVYLMRRRTAKTYIQKVKAHSGINGNEVADALAKAAMYNETEDEISTYVPESWRLNGARLSKLSFHDIYTWVAHLRKKKLPERALSNIQGVVEEYSEWKGEVFLPETVWLSPFNQPLRKQISDFLWRGLHGKTVCGAYFLKWGGEWEERAYCICGGLEDLEHILVGCLMAPWKDAIWREVVEILNLASPSDDEEWEPPTFWRILGVGLYSHKNKPRERTYKVIISEAAFVIWKLRNTRRIRGERVTPGRAVSTLHDALFRRAKTDLAMAKLPEMRSGKGKNTARLIRASWENLISYNHVGKPRWAPYDNG